MDKRTIEKEIESKYIQQHLANERTFLAWIRTAGAIMGIGFLATGYHFQMIQEENRTADNIALFIGGFSLLLGVLTISFALYSYLTKRQGINTQTFRSSYGTLIVIAFSMLLLTIIYSIYLFVIY